MGKIIGYQIFGSINLNELSNTVGAAIEQGWEPIGGCVTFEQDFDANGNAMESPQRHFMQTMIQRESIIKRAH
jgi:hypothetical protein